MSEMIERIAEGQANFDGRKLMDMPRGERERYRQRARLAIEAIRTVTKEMDAAGYDAYPRSSISTGVDHLDIYRAMISAALGKEDRSKPVDPVDIGPGYVVPFSAATKAAMDKLGKEPA